MKISLPLFLIATAVVVHAVPNQSPQGQAHVMSKRKEIERPDDQKHIVFRNDDKTQEFYCYKMITDREGRERHRCDDINTPKCCDTLSSQGGKINDAKNCHTLTPISHDAARKCCEDFDVKAIIVDREMYGVPH